jgi:quercetin dioxygenase-like cupin family protein
MAWKTMAAAMSAALLASCYAQPAQPTNDQSANDQSAAAAPAPANPVQTRYDQTMSGQPLTRPPEPFQLLVTQASFPRGHVITCHKHSWPRYVYLQSGRLRVTNYDARQIKEFRAGDILVEAIGQWHQGDVLEAVTLVAFEQVPPGGENSTPWPPPPPPQSPCRPWTQ